jgi:hypothetical protein
MKRSSAALAVPTAWRSGRLKPLDPVLTAAGCWADARLSGKGMTLLASIAANGLSASVVVMMDILCDSLSL